VTVYVSDTHALIWRLIAPARLSSAANDAFDQADAGEAEVHIPAVVLAEMIMVAERGRVPGWETDQARTFAEACRGADNFILCDLTPDLVLRSMDLDGVPDIFDRLIAAEALSKGAALISRDQDLAVVKGLHVIWDSA
jgi:PIN domain nuclease of toxin-antitoxin system